MGLTALASSTRRDALTARATARRRVFEPEGRGSPDALARSLPELDISPPAGMPRYLELGPGERGLPPPRTVSAEVEAAASVPDDAVPVPAAEALSADAMAPPVASALDAVTAGDGAMEPEVETAEDVVSEAEAEGSDVVAAGAASHDTRVPQGEAGLTGAAVSPGSLPPEAAGDLLAMAMDDTALIDEELAEHERWAGSFGALGTAGSDERARFLLYQAGEGAASGFWGGLGMGAVMGAAGGALGHIAGRRLATLAVSRGATAVPVPGLGPAIGGVMAIAGLFTRDWGASFDTIGRVGTGEGYEGLANDLEGIAEALDMACTFMDIVGGVCGAIAVGMWVGAVVSGGALAPLALTLSAIGTGISVATTAVGLIINVAVRPAVTALRALHAFESQGDPAAVEAAGASLSSAAGQLTGAAGGALGGRAGGHLGTRGGAGLYRAGTAVAARRTGGRPAMRASAGPGPRVHLEMPEAPVAGAALRPDAPATSVTTARPAAADGPTASSPVRRNTEPHSAETPHPITPDVVIRGDFSDASINVLTGRNRGAADAGDVGPHRMHGHRGTGLISEHVIPGAQMRDATFDPGTGTPDWQRSTAGGSDGSDYRNATTIVEHAAVAARKTTLDNAATTALQRRGGPRNLVDDLLLPSLERHERATADAIRTGEIRPDQATDPSHRALAALAEMWGGGSAGGGARARADAAASGGSASLPRARAARVDAEAARTRARIAQEGGITDIDWDATFSHPERSADATGPAASSPRRAASDAASPTGGAPPRYAPHTETVRTPDRAAAMAQYHEQIRTDPTRESGVWRGPDGTFYVMQGDGGSVRPPSASGPLTLVYHSHPVVADTAHRGMVSQPSQARGDFGVLAHEHGTGGPAGRRVESELHFPTYGPDGAHTGFGATRFAYDPTSPLPLQVTTTLPGGRPATHRYASYADFEARTGIRAGGDTPAASTAARVDADTRLSADRAAAAHRIDETAGALAGFRAPLGAREGRDEARTAVAEADPIAGVPSAPGPAYAVSVAGLAPGESMELPVNPAYPSPPGTPEQLDALLDQVDAARAAAQALGNTEARMAENEAIEHEHAAGLEEAIAVSNDLGVERETHAGEVETTSGANDTMLTQAGEAYESLGESSRDAAALASLVVSLDAFRGMAHLFSHLPGDLGIRAETARNDAARLITTLNRVSDADAAQAAVGTGREAIEGDGERIDAVASEGESTDMEVADGASALAELEAANAASLAETETTQSLANRERHAAEDSEAEARGAHDTLLAELQGWAQAHQLAREDAVAQAMGAGEALGLRATELAT